MPIETFLAKGSSVIETGVDKLVNLVKERRRISVPDAAKELGVSKVVIEEWADFLEEEGIVVVEYKFTTAYLVDRVMTKRQVEDKINEFKGKKEGFVRKAEVAMCNLDKNSDFFVGLKEDFTKLKGDLSKDVDAVREELLLLDKYNEEKLTIDQEIAQQERMFKEKILTIEAQIEKERRKYADLLDEVRKEQAMLDSERVRAGGLRQMLVTLERTAQRFESTVLRLRKGISSEKNKVEGAEGHIKRLTALAQATRKQVLADQKDITVLIAKSRENQNRIRGLQRKILQKSKQKATALKGQRKMPTERFKAFFEHNKKVEEVLAKIQKDKLHLQQELDELIRKAKAFNILSKKGDAGVYILDLQKKYKQLEHDKQDFEHEVGLLRKLIRR